MFKSIIAILVRRIYKRFRIIKFDIFSTNKSFGGPLKKHQPVLLMGKGRIVFGRDVNVGVSTSPKFWSSEFYIEARSEASKIEVGSGTWFNNCVSVISHKDLVKIGELCLVGHDVLIVDSDFHCINPDLRHSGGPIDCGPVFIGNNVFIGSQVTILKKTIVGAGSVIAAGSVVSGQFPPNSLIAGNPARLIRTI